MPTCGFIKVQPDGLKEKAAKSTQKWDPVSKRLVKILVPQVVEVVPEPVETLVIETLIEQRAGTNIFNLRNPRGLAFDRDGNMFIADTLNQCIRRVDAGTGFATTVAGNGGQGFSGDGGPAISASFNNPQRVAVDNGGNLFIADYNNRRIRRVAAGTGIITTVAGTGSSGFSGDGGPATSAAFRTTSDVEVDSGGNFFISDAADHRIRRVDAATGVITTVAGTGTEGFSGDGGLATESTLSQPAAVAFDKDGNMFISEYNPSRIRRVDVGTGRITTVAGTGSFAFSGDGGLATESSISLPVAVAFDRDGNMLISEYNPSRIRRVDVGTGRITTVAGVAGPGDFNGDGIPATSALLWRPEKIMLDRDGNIFIADSNNNRIRRVDARTGIITTFLNTSINGSSYTDISISLPRGVTVSGSNLYVVDTQINYIYVFNKNSGILNRIYNETSFNQGSFLPFRVAVDSVGNVYVANGDIIMKINYPTGNSVIIAGGRFDINTSSGTATTKRLSKPNGVAVYGDIVYFTNTNVNNVCKVVNGQISNLPGTYSFPEGIAVDSEGNVYIANPGLNKITKVTPANIVSDVALPAGITLNYPRSVAVDTTGNIYIADGGNGRVLKLNKNNTVDVLATGLNIPMDVSVDTDGTVYVAEYQGNRILKIYYTYV